MQNEKKTHSLREENFHSIIYTAICYRTCSCYAVNVQHLRMYCGSIYILMINKHNLRIEWKKHVNVYMHALRVWFFLNALLVLQTVEWIHLTVYATPATYVANVFFSNELYINLLKRRCTLPTNIGIALCFWRFK